MVMYAHCAEILVKEGAVLRAGESVAKVGSTGNSTGNHLHVEALVEEIHSGGGMARALNLRCRTFYMGGGTPTTLTAGQLDRVLTALEDAFDLQDCEELTVEAGRPDTITAEKLAVLKSPGITRISVNPQTMEDAVLRAIGRRHTAREIEHALDLAAAYGFPHENID